MNREIETFLALGRADRVFAIIVDGEPNTGDARECFPPALRALEGVAADARPQGDGKSGALLKLLAGLLGVSFDELRRRHDHQRYRRLQVRFAAALGLVAAFAALAWYSNDQRLKAVAARNQAESVLEFLVYDLQDKLQPLGRLDILSGVQRRVRQYFLQMGVGEDDVRFAYNYRVAQANEADRLLAEGDLNGALLKYQQCLAAARQQAEARPDDDALQESLAVYDTKIGTVQRRRGDTAAALASFRDALAIVEAVSSRHPDDESMRQRTAKALRDIGLTLAATGDLPGALEPYRKAWDTLQLLLGGPSAPDYRADARGIAVEWSQMLLRAGDVPEALRICRLAIDFAEEVQLQNPQNVEARASGAAVRQLAGDILMAAGRAAEAEELFRSSAATMTTLTQHDPLNHEWQRGLAVTRNKIGDALLARKDYTRALEAYRDALAISRALLEKDPNDVVDQHDMEVALGQIGFVLQVQGVLGASTEAYTSALAIAERLAAQEPSNPTRQVDVGICHCRLGQPAAKGGRADKAESEFRRAHAAFATAQRGGYRLAPPFQKAFDELEATFTR